MQVRLARPIDIPAITQMESQDPKAAHWSTQQYEKIFLPETKTEHSERVAWVVEAEGRVAEIFGFLVANRVDGDWEVENIVVLESMRRRGFGRRLLRELIAHASAQKGGRIFLEVRESNLAARGFYREAGFEESGLRHGYYSHPSEDAILLRLQLA